MAWPGPNAMGREWDGIIGQELFDADVNVINIYHDIKEGKRKEGRNGHKYRSITHLSLTMKLTFGNETIKI